MSAGKAQLTPTPRLAGFGLLASFALVLVTLLVLVFPSGSEYAAFTSAAQPDAYSVAYLDVLTRANPKEHDLRLVYGRQLAALGRYDEAWRAIAPVLGDARLGAEAKELALDVGLARARAMPEGGPERAAAFADVHARLSELLPLARSVARSEALANLALELDDPRLASEFYLDLAVRHPGARSRYLAAAARWQRAAGDDEAASLTYRSAHDTSASPVDAIDYAVLAVASLESADRPVVAADLAASFAALHPSDARILAAATRLATANSRAVVARDLGRRLLALAPGDEDVMREQVQRELAAGDPRASLQLLDKLVARHPDEYGLRLLRARVAEWAGDLDTSVLDLQWLIAHRQEAPPP